MKLNKNQMTNLKLLNTLTIDLRWQDMDAYGHVGNARYYDFMTDARVALMGADEILTDRSIQYVIAESGCTYKRPLQYPGKVLLKQYLQRLGNSSFTLHYEFLMADKPEEICAESFCVMVCFDANIKQAVRLTKAVRQLFEAIES